VTIVRTGLWLLAMVTVGCGGKVVGESNAGGDAGSTSSSGASSSGSSGTGSSGTGSTSGSGGSSGGTSGSGSGGSSGSGSGGSDDGGSADTCSADVPYTATTWTNVVAHQGVCQATDISAFEEACGDNATQTTCDAWLTANLAGVDGGGGTACGNCILPANALGTGGASFVTFDSMMNGYFEPNYPACIQILDPTSGSACAGAYYNLFSCVGLECNDCTGTAGDGTSEDPEACDLAVEGTGAICASYFGPYQTRCATDDADGGIADQCSPGGGTTLDPDWSFIINLICGASGDAGG
jgi:hypothetical protein